MNCFFDIKYLNCEVSAFYLPIRVLLLPSGIAPGGCFPRARLQPPRKNHSAGSSDTCYSHRSHRPPLTRTSIMVQRSFLITKKLMISKPDTSEGNTRRLLEKENRFFCVRCFSKKLSLSCGKAKTMKPHSGRSLRVRRLIASPRKAQCISGAVSYVAIYRGCVKTTNLFDGKSSAQSQSLRKKPKGNRGRNENDLVIL